MGLTSFLQKVGSNAANELAQNMERVARTAEQQGRNTSKIQEARDSANYLRSQSERLREASKQSEKNGL